MFDPATVFSSFVGALALVVYALECMRISGKLGCSPLLGLLMLVPMANFLVVVVYAYAVRPMAKAS